MTDSTMRRPSTLWNPVAETSVKAKSLDFSLDAASKVTGKAKAFQSVLRERTLPSVVRSSFTLPSRRDSRGGCPGKVSTI